MDAELDKIKGIKDGREQLLVFQYTREDLDGVLYACKINFDGLKFVTVNDVVGAIIAIMESYSDSMPEAQQVQFEKEVTGNLLRMIETRHEHILRVERE